MVVKVARRTRMPKRTDSTFVSSLDPAGATRRFLRRFLLICVLALPPLTGCGYLTRWYHGRPGPPNPHSVTISWTASPSAIQGYYVYRSASAGAPVRLNVRAVEGTQYTDHTAQAGQTYNYYVTSVDLKGTESAPSAYLTVSVPWTVKAPAPQ
jgi:hypothetical protein